MRFETLDELWMYYLDELLEATPLDSRDGKCLERLGVHFTLEDPTYNWIFNPVRNLSKAYGAIELLWYLSGENRIDMLLPYAPSYERFAEDKIAHGAYGARMDYGETEKRNMPLNQLEKIYEVLHERPNTRQAVVPLWHPQDIYYVGSVGDLPCTLSLVFNIRAGKLHLHTMMRSQDVWMGLPYDVWCFTCLQQLMAWALKVDLGEYHHTVASLHLYDRHSEKAKQAVVSSFSTKRLQFKSPTGGIVLGVEKCLGLLTWIERGGCTPMAEEQYLGKGSLLHQLLAMLRTKWSDGTELSKCWY
jgi:thymidylate synthase